MWRPSTGSEILFPEPGSVARCAAPSHTTAFDLPPSDDPLAVGCRWLRPAQCFSSRPGRACHSRSSSGRGNRCVATTHRRRRYVRESLRPHPAPGACGIADLEGALRHSAPRGKLVRELRTPGPACATSGAGVTRRRPWPAAGPITRSRDQALPLRSLTHPALLPDCALHSWRIRPQGVPLESNRVTAERRERPFRPTPAISQPPPRFQPLAAPPADRDPERVAVSAYGSGPHGR